MRTTIYAGSFVLAASLALPTLAETQTQGGKQPAQPGVQSGQQQSDSKDMTTPGTGMKSGSAEAPQGGKQPAQPGVQSGQQPGAATGQGAGTPGAAGTGTSGSPGAATPQPGVAPQYERGATEDMTRAVPPMKPGEGAGTGAAPGTGQAGGWTADQKLRETGKEGAVEKSPSGGASGQSPTQPSR